MCHWSLRRNEHCYARTEPFRDGKPAAGGTTYVTTGRSGTESYTDTVQRYCDDVYYNPVDMPMYLTLQVKPDAFVVTAYKNDGTVIDAASIAAPPVQKQVRTVRESRPRQIKRENAKAWQAALRTGQPGAHRRRL